MRVSAAALGKHPREVQAPVTQSMPVWRTDNIHIIIYGQMFSGNAFPAIGHVDDVVGTGILGM